MHPYRAMRDLDNFAEEKGEEEVRGRERQRE